MSFKCPECKERHGKLLKGYDGRCFWCLLKEDIENREDERKKKADKARKEARKAREREVGMI